MSWLLLRRTVTGAGRSSFVAGGLAIGDCEVFSYLQHGIGESKELRKKILYLLTDMGMLVHLGMDCFGNFVIQACLLVSISY